MARPKTVNCVICGGHVDEVGPLSTRKRCEGCGVRRTYENIDALISRRGDDYERWRLAMVKRAETIIDRLGGG